MSSVGDMFRKENMVIPKLPTVSQGLIEVPDLDNLQTLDILWANKFEDETFDPEFAQQTEANFYKGAPPMWLNFHWAEKQGSPLIKREGYDYLRHLIQRRQEKNWSLSDIYLYHQPGSGGSTLAMHVLWDLRKVIRCARLIDITSDAKAISRDVVQLFNAGGEGHENTVLLLVDNQHLIEEYLYKNSLHESLLSEIDANTCQTNISAVIVLYCSIRDFTRSGTVVLKARMSANEERMLKEAHARIIKNHADEHEKFYGFKKLLLQGFRDMDTDAESKTHKYKMFMDILSPNIFQDKMIDPAKAKNIEANFYTGAPPQWLNFYWAEKQESPLVKRDGYKRIIQLIQVQRRSKWYVCSIKLIHDSHCGATTLAMQVLWDLRKEFLCAVLKGSAEDSNEIANQILQLHKQKRSKQHTVLLLVDNLHGHNLCEHLNKEFNLRFDTTSCNLPVVIVIHLERKSMFFETGVTLLTDLLPEEMEICKERLDDIRRVHEPDMKHFHGLNILLQNFNQNYAKSVINSEITDYVKEHRHDRSTKLFAFLALANLYVPGSFLFESLCHEFGLYPHASSCFSDFILTFSKIGAEQQVQYIKITHPMIAEECVQSFEAAGVSRGQMCWDFLSLIKPRGGEQYLLQTVKTMLTKRTTDDGGHDMFSKLVLDIKNPGECTEVLKHASNVFSEYPFFPQTLARFYYLKLTDYDKAEIWAETAIMKDQKNSYIMDTLGQVHKNHLRKTVKDKSYHDKDILDIAQSAFMAFQKEEELANKEDDTDTKTFGVPKSSKTFNYRGVFGYIQVADLTFQSLKKQDAMWSDLFTHKASQQVTQYVLQNTKVCRYKSFITGLKNKVEEKFHFFEGFLTYSKPGKWDEEPPYLRRDVELCYSKFAGTEPKTLSAYSFPTLLSRLDRDAPTDDIKLIAQKCRNQEVPDDLGSIINYILIEIILNIKQALEPTASLQNLRAILQKFMHKHCSPEFFLLSMLLFWPDDNESYQLSRPVLNELVMKMRQSFEQQWKRQMRFRYLVPLFFIGQGEGLKKIVHKSKMNHKQIRQLTSDEKSANIKVLRRIQGRIKKPRVLAAIAGQEIEVMPHSPASVRGDGNISFYLGFTIRGPVAMCIKTEEVSAKKGSYIQSVKTENKPHERPGMSNVERFSKWKVFVPEIYQAKEETLYRLRCQSSGLVKCKFTGLMFKMETAGEVEYHSVPWGDKLDGLQWKPAGPLYSIKSLQGTLVQLHLPHCEVISEGKHCFLRVAHITEDGPEIIKAKEITESHVVIAITELSLFGNITEFFWGRNIQAQVLLFLQPSTKPALQVLLLSSNIDIEMVKRKRAQLINPRKEFYIDINPYCDINTQRCYHLVTVPEMSVTPDTASYVDCKTHNFPPTFTVYVNSSQELKLMLRDERKEVWSSLVPIEAGDTVVGKEEDQEQCISKDFFQKHKGALKSRLPVLGPILSWLEQRRVLNSTEREEIQSKSTSTEKNNALIMILDKKGPAAQGIFCQVLSKEDPFLVKDLMEEEKKKS